MTQWRHAFALLLLAAFFFLFGLGDLGLTDRDEGSNAEAAREMVESGNWLYPTLNGEPRFAKPIFIYWLTSTAYSVFGISEFTARLPSAVFAIALILLQYLFVAQARSPALGLLASLMLLLNMEVVAIGRLALTDSVLIFFTTLSLFGFWLGFHADGARRRFMWFFYVGMALGTLTKGPVGLLIPLLAVVPYLILTRRWKEFWHRGAPLTGLLIVALIATPWYAAMLWIHGSRYTASAQADTVGRFFSVIGGHGGTVFFYLPVLLLGFFPWSGWLPMALYQALRPWRHMRGPRPSPGEAAARPAAPEELEFFAALWLITVFLFFSLSATRLPHYIGPLFPAAALLVASYWWRCLEQPQTPGIRLSLRLVLVLGYLLGFALVLSSSFYASFIDQVAKEFPMARQVEPGPGLPLAGFVLLVGVGLVAYLGLTPERRHGAFWAAGATIGLVILIALTVVMPRFTKYFIDPPHELAYVAGLNLDPQDQLIVYGPPKPSVLFYAKRRAVMVKPGEEKRIADSLSQTGRTMILLPARLKSKLPDEAAAFPTILERYGYSLLAREPMVTLPPQPEGPPTNPHGF